MEKKWKREADKKAAKKRKAKKGRSAAGTRGPDDEAHGDRGEDGDEAEESALSRAGGPDVQPVKPPAM